MTTFKNWGLKQDESTYIIAEAGINHNGQMDIAKQLIQTAAERGADCVKFQKRTVSRILTKEGLERPYLTERSFGPTYGEHKKFLEFSNDQFLELFEFAKEVGIHMTASGWDEESVDFLASIPVPFLKMASADLTNFPLLEHAAKKGLPIVLSTGMSDFATVQKAYELVQGFNPRVAIMQCTSTYPCKPEDIHLNVLQTYKLAFPEAVLGYSGHEVGIATTVAASVLGAKVVERHFTLDRTMKGGDHAASLEPGGLEKVCKYIRVCEQAMGSPHKRKLDAEQACFVKLSKSVVSAIAIPAGTVITRDMLTTKGPGRGISPMDMEKVVGKAAMKDIPEDIVMCWNEHVATNP